MNVFEQERSGVPFNNADSKEKVENLPSENDNAMPRINSLVKFILQEDISEEIVRKYAALGLEAGKTYLFMGEIIQMQGHCIVANDDGRVIWGFHTENFVELKGAEL